MAFAGTYLAGDTGRNPCGRDLNMEIYRLGTRLFMIVETPDDFDWDASFARLATMDKQAEWEDFVAKYQKAVPGSSSSEKWQLMECMFKLPGASK